MQLSIVILNYNVRYFLELCLQSVQQSIKHLDAEIIVIDNNSVDGSCAMVKEKFPRIQLIENKKNIGFAKANNQAVTYAKGKYLCILNPDTVVAENTFQNILKKIKHISNLGILGVKLINGQGCFLPESKRNLPTPKVSLLKMMGGNFSTKKPYYATHISENDEGNVSVLVGAFMFLKKEIYEQVQGFDEDYFMYGEDIDLSYRIEKLGYKNYYLGTEKIIHYKGESTFKDKVYKKRFYGAMQLFYQKHFKSSYFLNAFVNLGIKMFSLISIPQNKEKRIFFTEGFFIGYNNQKLQEIKQKAQISITPITTEALAIKKNNSQEINSICFFDMDDITYQKAIHTMEQNFKEHIYFRMIPQGANFALGSDTVSGRGEVLQF